MEDIGCCSSQMIPRSALVERLHITHENIGPLMMLAMQGKVSPTPGVDAEVGLSVLTQMLCSGLGMNTKDLVHAYKPYMRAALLHLSSDPAQWIFEVEDDAEPRAKLFGLGEGAGLRRRALQELLGNQERPTHRYLVRKPGQAWSGLDDVGEQVAAGAEPMICILDAIAVADQFSSSVAGPFFLWKPGR